MLLLPIDFELAHKTLEWYRGDSEEKYHENIAAGHQPLYGPGDIAYNFNSLGFRGRDIKPKTDTIRICFYGCSLVEGYGLPWRHSLPAVFAESIGSVLGSVEYYNFGKASASNDLISELVVTSQPVAQPDLVVIYWTYFSRRQLHTPDGKVLKWNQHWKDLSVPLPNEYEELYEAQNALINSYSDLDNFLKNFQLVKHFLRAQGIPMIWGLANAGWFAQIGHHLDEADLKTYADMGLREHMSDYARDMHHPGPDTVRLLNEKLIQTYVRSHT